MLNINQLSLPLCSRLHLPFPVPLPFHRRSQTNTSKNPLPIFSANENQTEQCEPAAYNRFTLVANGDSPKPINTVDPAADIDPKPRWNISPRCIVLIESAGWFVLCIRGLIFWKKKRNRCCVEFCKHAWLQTYPPCCAFRNEMRGIPGWW